MAPTIRTKSSKSCARGSSPEEYRGFLRGNVIKYIARAQLKGGLEDYEKAKWYQAELVRFERAPANRKRKK